MLIEVAHPDIVSELGSFFLQHCDLFVTSVTSLADPQSESALRNAATSHGLYIPTGAGWGVSDIRKMSLLGTLKSLEVTMQFNAQALRLLEPAKSRLESYLESDDQNALVLHRGNIRDIARIAPNNVNTMICLALAGDSVGLDHAVGCLIAQKEHDAHIVDIEVVGPDGFRVKTTRYNPARKDAVTGAQTYGSFLISLVQAGGQGPGLHFC
jgi:predicted dinucleotide-utilizing enzyme